MTIIAQPGAEAPGEARRDAGVESVRNADGNFRDHVDDVIGQLARSGETFTIEDVRRAMAWTGLEPEHHNSWGAALSAARHEGTIEAVGFTLAQRETRHAGVIRVWKGC